MTASHPTPSQASVSASELARWLDSLLNVQAIADYCPNGLQVAGKSSIQKVVTGVTASKALLEHAVRQQADAVLVHHGWFWKNEDPRLIGVKRERIALALKHELNLFGFHLPLDMHPVLGNNAQLAKLMGWQAHTDSSGQPATCGPDNLVWTGTCPPQTLQALGQSLGQRLQRQPLVIGDGNATIQRLAWCSGGAQNMMQAAIDAGAQVFITGEASEPNFHLANESGVAFIAAGHHATERYGVKALGEAVARQFGITVEFIDLDNPI